MTMSREAKRNHQIEIKRAALYGTTETTWSKPGRAGQAMTDTEYRAERMGRGKAQSEPRAKKLEREGFKVTEGGWLRRTKRQ